MKPNKEFTKRPDILAKYFNEIIKLKYDVILKKHIYLEESNIIILYNDKTYTINIIELNDQLYWRLSYNCKDRLFDLSIESFKNIISLIQIKNYDSIKIKHKFSNNNK